MTNMKWDVSNGATNIGSVQNVIHVRLLLCTIFVQKTDCQKYFFKSFPKTTLRLWISKIRIWIWSEQSTLRVDSMDSWSVSGFAPQKRKICLWIRKSEFGFSQKTHPETWQDTEFFLKKKGKTKNCLCLFKHDKIWNQSYKFKRPRSATTTSER